MFTLLNPFIYLLLTLVWASILWFSLSRLKYHKTTSAFFVTVLVILSVDASRTIVESVYFGIRTMSISGMLPASVAGTLKQANMMFIPKFINLVAALVIGILLYKKWLPMQEADQRKTEQHIKELEDRTRAQGAVEKALRESEQRFRSIMDSSPMGMHIYELRADDSLIFTGANPAADQILGINHKNILGKPIEVAFPALAESKIPEHYREVCRTGQTWQDEDIHYEDGSIAGAFEIYAFQTMTGQMATQFVDITKRKQAEEALSITQFTVDNAAIGIFWVGIEGNISYVNQAGCDLLGYTKREILSLRIDDLTPDISIRSDVLKRIKETGSTSFEAEGLRKDESVLPIGITSHHIEFGKDEFELIFVTDLTEQKDTEDALEAMNKNLEAIVEERTRALKQKAKELEDANIRLTGVDRMKSAMLSSVTHELKTPLTSIIGYTKLTDRDFVRDFLPLVAGNASLTNKGERINENLSIVGQESARLLGLIDNFLALSRIRSGFEESGIEPINMAEAIQHAVNLSQSYFSVQPDISLEVDIADNLPTITADRDNVLRVLINLLENAAKFGNEGVVFLTATADNTTLSLKIKDSGPGIPPEERSRIFEPFYQICEDDDCTIKPDGAGLGLAICKQIVENAGGSIRLQCPTAGGCEFIVEFPLEADTTRS